TGPGNHQVVGGKGEYTDEERQYCAGQHRWSTSGCLRRALPLHPRSTPVRSYGRGLVNWWSWLTPISWSITQGSGQPVRYVVDGMACGFGGFAGLDRLDGLADANDDEPYAGGQGEHSDGLKWPHQHRQAGDHRDDADDDIRAAARQIPLANTDGHRGHTLEDEADSDPQRQQQHRIAVAEVTERHDGQHQ